MISTGRAFPLPRAIPDALSRAQLLDWIRGFCPDLRIRRILDEGQRRAVARFTFGGEVYDVEATEAPDVPDPDDTIVRRCAWLLYRRMGIHTAIDDSVRRDLERAIVQASQAGNTARVDMLALELARLNEASPLPPTHGSRFERFGGSMFKGQHAQRPPRSPRT